MRWRNTARLAMGVAGALAATTLVFWLWIIPGAIASRFRALVPGTRVTFATWSPGALTDVRWYEGPQTDAPLWASCERLETDLTWGRLLRGETWPGSVALVRPGVTLRVDASGAIPSRLSLRLPDDQPTLPTLTVRGGRLRIEQLGRPPFVVEEVEGELKPGANGLVVTARTRNGDWGRWRADGQLAPDLASGSITLSGLNVDLGPDQVRLLPFVAPRVWDVVVPMGTIDVRHELRWGSVGMGRTWVHLRNADLDLPAIGLTIEASRGQISHESRLTRFDHVNGAACDGQVGIAGTLDTRGERPVVALDVRLEDVEVAALPAAVGLDRMDVEAGRLTGVARVVATLGGERPDLSGSSGTGSVRQAVQGGREVGSIILRMTATAGTLAYETDPMAGPE